MKKLLSLLLLSSLLGLPACSEVDASGVTRIKHMTGRQSQLYQQIPASGDSATNPPDLGDILVYLHGDHGTFEDDGLSTEQTGTGDVCGWEDQRNSNDATQGTADECPHRLAAELNGKACLEFDGNNDHIDLADAVFSGLSKGSVLFVFKLDNQPPASGASGWSHFGAHVSSDHMTWIDGRHYTSLFSTIRRSSNCGVPSGCPENLPTMTGAYAWLYVRSGDSGVEGYQMHITVSGTEYHIFDSAANTLGFPSANISIGESVSASYNFDGGICAVIVWDDADDRKAAVTTFVANEWGI